MKYFISLIAVLALATSAYADAVAISNASFEEPALDLGGWSNDLAGGWEPTGDGGNFIEYIDGFSSDGNQHLGMAEGHESWQDLGVGLNANTRYTLTVNAGNRNDGFTPAGQVSTFGLYAGGSAGAGGVALGSSSWDAEQGAADGTFGADIWSVVSTGATVEDGNIHVSLQSTGPGRAHYDNIRLDATPLAYSQSFSAEDGATDLGDGSTFWSNDGLNSVQGGVLRMTEAGTNGSNATFKVGSVAGAAAGWTATFDLEMTHAGANTPADGLSFIWGELPNNGDDVTGDMAAEEGWSDTAPHIAFQVDTWKWDDVDNQDAGWTIRTGGPGVDPPQDSKGFAHQQQNNEEAIIGLDETVKGQVMVSYDAGANTVSYQTSGFRVNADFTNVAVPAGFDASGDYEFAIRARTGGHNQTTIIDNLAISVVPEPGAFGLIGMAALGLLGLRRRNK